MSLMWEPHYMVQAIQKTLPIISYELVPLEKGNEKL
jgi:hypothetical protein